MSEFEKYKSSGPYHWRQADSGWRNPQFNPLLVARYQVLLSFLPPSVENVLDIGCGDGYLMYLILVKGIKKVYGIDNNWLGVSLAYNELNRKNKNGNWSVIMASGDKVPIQDNQFDAVILADVIEHLFNPQDTLMEINRVLRSGGILLLSTPNKNPEHVWDRSHVQEFKPDSLKSLLDQYFKEVNLQACWPMRWYYRWRRGGFWQSIINCLTRIGYNPFLKVSHIPSLDYGQLVAVCRK